MQLRRFTAPSLAEAMARVRAELGDNAAILDTDAAEGGAVTITAALDAAEEAWAPAVAGVLPDGTPLDCAEAVQEVIAGHGLPARLAERLLAAALDSGA